MFEHHNGDILNTKAQVIAHQANCLGVMGAGVAKAIRDKYPAVYLQYKRLCSEPFDPLGTCQMVQTEDGYVANLFGQYGIRNKPGSGRVTDYEALRSALTVLKDQMKELGLTSVAMPYKLGCGLGGGDWDTVDGIIHSVFDDSGILVEYWQL